MTDPTLPPPAAAAPGIDPVHRLRVMAAAVRGAHVAEHVVQAPFEEVWPVMAALGFLPDFHRVRVVRADADADGGRFEALARGRYGFRAHLRGFARPGWCWLQSRFLIVGLAAAPPRTRPSPGSPSPAAYASPPGRRSSPSPPGANWTRPRTGWRPWSAPRRPGRAGEAVRHRARPVHPFGPISAAGAG